jgi:hypothetical protein
VFAPFQICDPQGAIFQKYAVESGGILKYIHPAGLIVAINAINILKTGRLQLPEVHRAKRLRAGDQTPNR